jgi:hypothetical protein
MSLGDETYFRKERIVGFEITIVEGAFAAAPALPIGWGIKIDNNASWQCSASGLVSVGAAAMSKSELENLFVIAQAPGTQGPPRVSVIVHTTKDFEHSTKRDARSLKLIPAVKSTKR